MRSVSRPAIGWSVAAACLPWSGLELAMLVPAAVADLDEPHAGLGEAPGQQALAAEVVGLRRADAVELLRRLRLLRQVHHLRQLALHPEGQLVRLDHPLDGRVHLVALERLRG